MLNGERLSEDENIKIESDDDIRVLIINKCQLTDAGKVSCILPGNKSSNAKLTVEGDFILFDNIKLC
jgi:hypothetical protein